MPNDRPQPLDDIIAESRPPQGDVPAELNNPRNYLVFSRLQSAAAVEDPVSAFTADSDGNVGVNDPETVLGITVGAVDPVTPEAIEAELAHKRSKDNKVGRDSSSYLPDWAAKAVTPPLAPATGQDRMVRRDGTRVRPECVIDVDNRSPYYPNSWPFSLVGRLFVWWNAASPNWTKSGTAGLLGTRTILTASHMVPWGSSNWKALFVPAYYNGASLFGSWAASWVTNAQGYSNHAQGDDMAVMRLAAPLGANLGFFGFRTYTSAWQDKSVWTLPGYAGDKDEAERPWLHLNFPIIDDDNDGAGVELEYRADTSGGVSGGPVFAWFNGSPDVVGTHSGCEDNVGEPKQNVAAGGNALTNLLHWARSTWP
ncbi:trypsin-like serine peptidase [Yinghuangia sp. YIM S10712]|uniref:trypsin-like serine peptidase n=1 Tax=Yinghuangia sp. YIM S10712 TaxID=3436930 RepID=UPI003F53BF7D